MKKILFLGFLFLGAFNSNFGQGPVLSGKYLYYIGESGCIWYLPTDNSASAVLYRWAPNGSSGLAIGPNYSGTGPNPTFWTVISGIYYYFNGTTFVSTGHSSGGSTFINPGASQNYIYNISFSGQVSRYNGTGPATVIATFSNTLVQDIVGDQNDNFYLLKSDFPQALNVYNSSGSLICTYSVSGCPGGNVLGGLAINKGVVNVHFNYGNRYQGTFNGNTVIFGSSSNLGCSPLDFASFPADVTMTPPLEAVPGSVLPCLGGTVALKSNNSLNVSSYAWSGPGIIGAVSGQSITLNQPGVYTRTVATCAGPTDVTTFTVTRNPQAPLYVSQSAQIKCGNDPPVSLSVSGLGNYTWTPSASLSSPTGSNVSASPNTTTTYTVSGQLNNCVGVSTVTLKASVIPNLNAASSTPSLCTGSVADLNSQAGNLSLNWMPGNYSTAGFTIVPTQSTTFTLTGTDTLGCKASEIVAISVINYPSLQITASAGEICKGENVTVTTTGASNYNYLPGNVTSGVLIDSPQSTTVYTVTGSNWNCSNSTTISVLVHDLPQLYLSTSSTLICAGETAILGVSGADSYVWDTGSANSSIFVSPSVTSDYSVIGIDAYGCSNNASITQSVSACTGINSLSGADAFTLYPNPGNGKINIAKANLTDDCTITIYNSTGQQVFKKMLSGTGGSIDLQNASQGIYIFILSANGRILGNHTYLHE
jgi:hypothetical protein